MNFQIIQLGGPADPKREFLASLVKAVSSRLRDLTDGPVLDATAVMACDCAACVMAKAAKTHQELCEGFEDDKHHQNCPCHFCISFYEGAPERELMDDACSCTMCVSARRDFERISKEMAEEAKSDTVESIQGLFLRMLGAPEDAVERLLSKIRNIREKSVLEMKEGAEQKLLPAPLSEEELTEQLQPAREAFKKLEEIAQTQSNTNKPYQEGTQMPESQNVKDRKQVDIGGKEPPRFETKGTIITYPNGMSPGEAAEWLLKREKEMEARVSVNEEIDAFPFDAAIAFHKAIERTFGWADTDGNPWSPALTLSVDIGVNQKKQVAWGEIRIPGIDGFIFPCAGHTKGDRIIFALHGEVKKKHREKIAELSQFTREILKTESIYKGKAIKPHFPKVGHGDMPSLDDMPKFFDSSFVDPKDVVFSKSVQEQIEVSLFTPIRETETCRKHRIPLKRTVLLAGEYGVGKTLTAAITAQLCEKNGWTFLLLEDASDIQRAIEFGKQHQPCVVFAEDIDRAVDGQERTSEVDNILNTIDGVEAKGLEMMFVLTTNHADRINKAMMRTGRVDAYIEVLAPDAEAVQRLARVYARDLMGENEDLTEVGKLLAGRKPSDVREAVERAKLAAIFHRGAAGATIKAEDLVTAANIMQPHFELMKSPPVPEADPIEHLLENVVRRAVGEPALPPLPTKPNGTITNRA